MFPGVELKFHTWHIDIHLAFVGRRVRLLSSVRTWMALSGAELSGHSFVSATWLLDYRATLTFVPPRHNVVAERYPVVASRWARRWRTGWDECWRSL